MDNNPYIADLSDKFRPAKVGKLFTDLYDNVWTEGLSVLEKFYNRNNLPLKLGSHCRSDQLDQARPSGRVLVLFRRHE
ncbi:hypothetical protein DPMN_044323 [Dreissena polymorpha]|uniref:Uncharacterized protein n=1 Tax=Dreissena polymorpha TaxID=45954 RepID=A0A9D4D312_DREPO|nr:hypothetical protein DPMN_044323 [Dreissena polymorpha]